MIATKDAGATGEAKSSRTPTGVIVVDLGKRKRKQIKRLRQGTGKLMEEVADVLSELRASGQISEAAEPVVVVVRERRRTPGFWF